MSRTYIQPPDSLGNKKRQFFSATKGANGDQLLIGPPAVGQEIVITAINIENITANQTTWQLKAGGVVFMQDNHGTTQNIGTEMVFGDVNGIRCGSGNNLILNLSGANNHLVNIQYYIDDVQQ